MNYFLFIVFFVASFFTLHALSRRDFVLVRKNITVSSMFDLGFLILFFGYIIGRIFFILDNNLYSWIHIIRFFHFFRLPGLSSYGAVIGILLGVLIFLKNKKAIFRVIDIFAISFLPLYMFDIITRVTSLSFIFLKIGTLLVFMLIFYLLLICNKNFTLKDGSITLVIFLVIALDTLLMRYYHTPKIFFYLFSFSEWVSVITILVSIGLLMYNERMLLRKE